MRRNHTSLRRARTWRAGGGLLATALLCALVGVPVGPPPAGDGPAVDEPAISTTPLPVDDAAARARAEHRALVRLAPGADADALIADLGLDPASVTHDYGDAGFAIDADDATRARLAADERVAGVDDDGVVRALGEAPPNVVRIHAPPAHQRGHDGGTGHGTVVRVAVVDTGVDLDHPELEPNLDTALGTDCTATGTADDDHGHGTHVAGTVAAVADGAGVLGVAPRARVVPVKVLDAGGSGTWSEVVCGLRHVLALATDADPGNDVQVVNMSLGGSGTNPAACEGSIARAVICDLTAAGVVVVVAAGNSSDDASRHIPAAFPEAVTVSALDDATDAMASFSNHGAGVDLTAPGVAVTSAARGGGLRKLSGTSMAAPAVAGAAAVLLAGGQVAAGDVVTVLRTHGECPDGTAAGADGLCTGQGRWAGDRDLVVEPLVRLDDAVGATAPDRRFLAPTAHHVVGGIVPITVAAADDDEVQVRIDDGPWHATTFDPTVGAHTWTWDTQLGDDGGRRIEAAVTVQGTTSVEAIEVTVRNGPVVTIDGPAPGGVRGDVALRVEVAHATEPPSTLTVAMAVPAGDGGTTTVPLTLDAASRWFVGTWDSRAVLDGSHRLIATATDSQGRVGRAEVTVAVGNPPVVTITRPGTGVLTGTVAIQATVASELHDPSQLEVTWVAGAASGTLTYLGGTTFEGEWDTLTAPDGSPSLRVSARDPEGRVGVGARWISVRNGPTVVVDRTDLSGIARVGVTATSPWHPPESLTATATVRRSFASAVAWPVGWDGTRFVLDPIDTTTWSESSATVTVTVTDPDGRVGTGSEFLFVRNQPTAVLVTKAVTGTATLEATVTSPVVAPDQVTVTAKLGSLGPWELRWDGTTHVSAPIDTAAWPEGTSYVQLTAVDPAGRTGSSSNPVTTRNGPTLTIVEPEAYARAVGTMRIAVAAVDPDDAPAALTVRLQVDAVGPFTTLEHDPETGQHVASVPTASWAEGYRRLHITGTDPAGHTTKVERSVYVRREAPRLSVVAPNSYADLSGDVPMAVVVTDADDPPAAVTVQLRIDGGAPAIDLAYDVTTGQHRALVPTRTVSDGPHTFTFTATDPAGKTGTASLYRSVRNAPQLTVVSPTSYATVTGDVAVAVTVVDPDDAPGTVKVQVVVDQTGPPLVLVHDPASGQHVGTLASHLWPDGSRRLDATAVDPSGRSATVTRWVTARNAPVVTAVAPGAGSTTRGAVPVSVRLTTAEPASATVTLQLPHPSDGATSRTMAYDAATGLHGATIATASWPDGSHRFRVDVRDAQGRTATVSWWASTANSPTATITPIGSVDGVLRVEATGHRGDGTAGGVDLTWRIDGGGWQPMAPHPTRAASGVQVADRDVRWFPEGSYPLDVQVRDRATGRTAVTRTWITVDHNDAFHVELVPAPGTPVRGVATLTALVSRPAGHGGGPPVSAFVQVDGGAWRAMDVDSELRATAPWDTRSLTRGRHTVTVAATDWQRSHTATIELEVVDSTPLTVTVSAPSATSALSGTVTIRAAVTGGALARNPGAPVTAWYRIDAGPWQLLAGAPGSLTAGWDTRGVAPGRHVIEVAAVDWVGGVTTTTRAVDVAPRLKLTVLSPAPGDAVGRPVAVAARLTSTAHAPTSLSVFARLSYGSFVTLGLGPDGVFRGTVPAGWTGVATLEVVATDYRGDVVFQTVPLTLR